jgi:hypothetical protein
MTDASVRFFYAATIDGNARAMASLTLISGSMATKSWVAGPGPAMTQYERPSAKHRAGHDTLVPYRLTLDTFCIKKSYQISAGMMVAAVRCSAAAVAARPALVR